MNTEVTTQLQNDVTEVPEVTTQSVGYEDIYKEVQSCNATLTYMLSTLIVIIVVWVICKILNVLGFNKC